MSSQGAQEALDYFGQFDGMLDVLLEYVHTKPTQSLLGAEELTSFLATLTNATTRLRRHINSLAPIHRLPSEVLCHVFTFVPRGYSSKRHSGGIAHIWGPSAIGPPSDLVPLMYVCREWRRIVRRCARFWSVIEDVSSGFSPKPLQYPYYIHRNRTGPLFVYIRSSFRLFEMTLKLIKESGSRVEELHAEESRYNASSPLPGTLLLPIIATMPASSLKTCKLQSVRHPSMAPTHILFDGHAPALRALGLCSLSWVPSNTFPSLTHLFLDYRFCIGLNVSYTFAQVLALLGGAPMLQVLYMIWMCEAHVKDIPHPGVVTPHVRLDFLRKLTIEERFKIGPLDHFALAIIAHTIRPFNTLIHVYMFSFAYIRHISRLLFNKELQNMQIQMHSESSYGYDFLSLKLVNTQRSSGVNITFYLNSLGPDSSDDFQLLRDALREDGLCKNVTTLAITRTALRKLKLDPSLRVLRALKSVHTLTLAHRTTPAECEDLKTFLDVHRRRNGQLACLFPHLQRLAVCVAPPVDWALIYGLALARKDTGGRLRRLVVQHRIPIPPGQERTREELAPLQQLLLGGVVDMLTVVRTSDGEEDTVPMEFMWREKLPVECTRDGGHTSRFWRDWE
ncbi:hypothetical protein C8Q80DRAFT_450959 [Daedaleopsis nitida]|nr:hypothetical protein C8Q80DRAFT_450959 [Daedaleopsis nitida]